MFLRNYLAFLGTALLCAQCAFSVEIDREGLPDTGLDTSDWTSRELPPLDDMWDLNDFQIAAKNTLAPRWYGACGHDVLNKSFSSHCLHQHPTGPLL